MGNNIDVKVLKTGSVVCIKEYTDIQNKNNFKVGKKYDYELTHVATEEDKYYLVECPTNKTKDGLTCISFFDDTEFEVFFTILEKYRLTQLKKIL